MSRAKAKRGVAYGVVGTGATQGVCSRLYRFWFLGPVHRADLGAPLRSRWSRRGERPSPVIPVAGIMKPAAQLGANLELGSKRCSLKRGFSADCKHANTASGDNHD